MENGENDDWDNLEADFCENNDSQDEYEAKIQELINQGKESGEPEEDSVYSGFLFSLRARVKLKDHGLSVEDAMLVLTQDNANVKQGSLVYSGKCDKGYAEIVVSSFLTEKEQNTGANYKVVTGYLK